jgi:uncharacterized protein (DUF362 family)
MRRREFLKGTMVSSLCLSLDKNPFVQGNKPPDMSVVKGGSPDMITRKAIDLLGGMRKFISKGDIVMIKPNIAFERKPQYAGCTNPDVVGTLVELCLESGAKEVKVMDNPVHPSKQTYWASGIAEAVKKAGGQVLYPDGDKTKSAAINGRVIKTASVFTDIIEADKLINVPILKTHPFTKLTMGMKNWLGAVWGNREIYHGKVNDIIVDLSVFFKPTLTVLDAYRIMKKNGPDGGSLSDVVLTQTVIAGKDFVAVDAMGATMCQYKPKALSSIKLANSLGFGELDLQKLKIEMRAARL